MPQILKNFLNSEKAVASAVPLVIATVFVFIGDITHQQWMDFAMAITGIYVGGKSIHGAAVAMGKKPAQTTEIKNAIKANDTAADKVLDEKFDS